MVMARLGLGFWKCRLWCIIFFITALLLQASTGASISRTCSLPDFSHRKGSASTWFASRSKRFIGNMDSVNWSKLRKSSAHVLDSTNLCNETDASCEDYMDWLYNHKKNVRKLYIAHTHGSSLAFGTLQTGRIYALSSSATEDLKAGDTILEFPLKQCIGDGPNDGALAGAPWEIQIATKLLTERSKGATSIWALYIKLLPSYVPLPMLFTDMEIQNIDDPFVTDEILEMRRFAIESFRILRGEEIAYAKFSEFVWALSIVYSSACKVEGQHFLLPFLGVSQHDGNVFFTTAGEVLHLIADVHAKKGASLSFHRVALTRTDAFLFQGVMPKNIVHDRARMFKDTNDLANWFFSTYGGVNENRYLTEKVATNAMKMLEAMKVNEELGDLSVGLNDYVDPYLVCILASLSFARTAIQLHNINKGGESPLDFDNEQGTPWEKEMKLIAYRSSLFHDSRRQAMSDDVDVAFLYAVKAIRERIATIMASYKTDSIEDEILLNAASWEGLDGAEDSCSSCRWQIEKQSLNDGLATEYRVSRKKLLEDILSKLQSGDQLITTESNGSIPTDGLEETSIQQFSTWCEENGFSLSEKLTIASITVQHDNGSLYYQSHVRGVQVSKDIEEGETLCTLPLDAGLYDESSASVVIADSWDLAAARLLQEKSLGNSSHWAQYIAILPRNMASPIYLDSSDIAEVQWWPVMRELIQVRRAIKNSFLLLQSFQVAGAEFEEYKWAAIMVHSRAFTLPVLADGKYSHYVLMPFMDMINHHYIYQADWMSQPVIDRKLEIVAKRPLKKGEQLFASFGPRSNDNLFLYYGFVLKDNPFDSAQIFGSFKDALVWFFETWSTGCSYCSKDPATCRSCNTKYWVRIWLHVKHAIEEFEGGSMGQSKDWWELVSKWADLGYQYLPYQPGPTVYAFGISDPSLVAAFAAAANIIRLPEVEVDSSDFTNKNKATLLQQFFGCMEGLKKPMYRPLLDDHSCQGYLVPALQAEDLQSREHLIARISIALRCVEVLASMPTTISEDKLLLEKGSSSIHIQLTREYRYRKKLLLKAVIARLLDGS